MADHHVNTYLEIFRSRGLEGITNEDLRIKNADLEGVAMDKGKEAFVEAASSPRASSPYYSMEERE